MDMLNIHQLPLQCSALFALRQSAVDLMTFQTIDWNEQTSQELDFHLITISKNNLSQWNSHIPANTFKIPSLSHYGSCQNIFTRKVTDIHIPASLYLTSCVPVPHVSGFHTWCPQVPCLGSPSPKSPHTHPNVPVPVLYKMYTAFV